MYVTYFRLPLHKHNILYSLVKQSFDKFREFEDIHEIQSRISSCNFNVS